ncbi:platelet-activating factor acetylhydrolase IB subunit alpha2-like isoform X2 [Gordionus sp. m RMFG-2023]|uniref:platelet-activating factor acetylhydrolase IB subunit alpha2-like isoform X2 n=1 Tax=Gordionus sp. m RMFG-2023 TaxID=3053472 RepID=UPI0031FBEE49
MKDTLLPVPGDRESRINSYMDRHERYVRETKESESEILFIGDSLIEHLVQTDIWDQFSQMHALNFGISGDKTQNVLWRIKNGELDFEDNKPKAVILLIGTNNTESTEDIVDGIIEIIKEIQIKLPNSYILVMGSIHVLRGLK